MRGAQGEPSYFRALFKRETGQTFHQYLTGLRMNCAMEMLRATSLKTAEIAQQTGLGTRAISAIRSRSIFWHLASSQVRKEIE
jgi:AraC-like DNA-binding protein